MDLRLFRSAGFTWGTALATLVSFSMMGLLFATPLYFQEVLGIDAFGNGLRQLPLIGGLLVGVALATRLSRRLGARGAIALGFAIIACGLALGARTSAADGSVYAMAWLAVAGAGLGIALPTAMDAALGALSPEHGGVGSGLIQALRMVGGAFGAAILGLRAELELPRRARSRRAARAGGSGRARTASRPASRSRTSWARQTCSSRCTPPSSTAWTWPTWSAPRAAVAGAVLALAFMPRREAAGERRTRSRRRPATRTRPFRRPADGHEVESGHGALVADAVD